MAAIPEQWYAIDANVFIQAHRNYYALDLCPGFWDALGHYHDNSRLVSIDRVRDEIMSGDALAEWVSAAKAEIGRAHV